MAVKQHHIGFRANDDENEKIRCFAARFSGGKPASAFLRDLILELAEQAASLPLTEEDGLPVFSNGPVVRTSVQKPSPEEAL